MSRGMCIHSLRVSRLDELFVDITTLCTFLAIKVNITHISTVVLVTCVSQTHQNVPYRAYYSDHRYE